MYKVVYREHGLKYEVTSTNPEPLALIVRHMYTIHNNYKGSVENFELLFFGEVKE
jgi:hypothetical protein